MFSARSSSRISSSTQRTSMRSLRSQVSNARKMNAAQSDLVPTETFINGLQLDEFFKLNELEQEERLAHIDAVDLLHSLQDINKDLAMLRLENHFLTDFLQKNDPKLLVGLQQQRKAREINQPNWSSKPIKDPSAMSFGAGSSFRMRASTTKSTITASLHGTASQKKISVDYKLNFRAKTDLAEKTANEIEKHIHELEKSASHNIKILRGHIEEMRYLYEESKETIKIFELHFMRDERDLQFLATATERQLERKIKKFVNNWLKNARALLSTMRLRITALHEHCQQLRSELLTKSDLSGILTAVDFEKLSIKRTELLNALEEKNLHMAGLKAVTGKASLNMSEEKQIMMNIEEESRRLTQKTNEVAKTLSKLNKEAKAVELENQKDMENLQNLRSQLEHFEAPSVHDYIARKDEVLVLEKEQKMLQRKLYILEMKLDNTQKRCKRLQSLLIANEAEDNTENSTLN